MHVQGVINLLSVDNRFSIHFSKNTLSECIDINIILIYIRSSDTNNYLIKFILKLYISQVNKNII